MLLLQFWQLLCGTPAALLLWPASYAAPSYSLQLPNRSRVVALLMLSSFPVAGATHPITHPNPLQALPLPSLSFFVVDFNIWVGVRLEYHDHSEGHHLLPLGIVHPCFILLQGRRCECFEITPHNYQASSLPCRALFQSAPVAANSLCSVLYSPASHNVIFTPTDREGGTNVLLLLLEIALLSFCIPKTSICCDDGGGK